MKIGISLSGGGARGVAHIGVLKALLEEGIQPTHIAGASAGAIVGVMYASGFTPDQMIDFVDRSKFYRIMSFGLPNGGLSKLSYLRERLEDVLIEDDFAALKMPLHIAITNLMSGELEIRTQGELIDVVVASCSIPLVFQPVEIDGALYVDGGLMRNMPVDSLLDDVDFIIGVNVIPRAPIDKRKLSSVWSVAHRCFDLAILGNTQSQAAQCNFVIEPEGIGRYGVFQFPKYKAIYELGYQTAKAQIPALKALMEKDV